MRIPEETVQGKAKITLSFPDWKEGKVAPATFEMTIYEPLSEADRMKVLQAERPSLHGYLSVADLDKFRAGRSKGDVLQDLQWRVGSVHAVICEGKKVMVLDYTLLTDPADVQKNKRLHAMFVDGKFQKFVRSESGVADKPAKVGEYSPWLVRLMNSPAVSVKELRKAADSASAPKEPVEVGLTIDWLRRQHGLKSRHATKSPPAPKKQAKTALGKVLTRLLVPPNSSDATSHATAEEYRWNAALRDQFNAARLDIGMTEQEVERVLNVRPKEVKGVREYGPQESGELQAGTCKVYGSTPLFPISRHLHHSRVVVVFREGKAIAIYTFPSDEQGRQEAPNGVIEYLKGKNAAAGASGDK